jgi:hypothetical protein
VKLAFIDFWPNFEVENNYFYYLLEQHYDVEINQRDPDLMFLHTDSYRNLDRKNYVSHPATRVFWTMEGEPPLFDDDTYPPEVSITTTGGVGYGDPNAAATLATNDSNRKYYYGRCDFALTHDIMDDSRHYRFPYWVYHIDWFNKGNYGGEPNFLIPLDQIADNEYYNAPKTKFCAHMVSNPTERRLDAHKKLNTYKRVDGHGNCFGQGVSLNDFHGVNSPWEKAKLETLKDYRFSICFEHKNRAGYHSEKLFHAKVAGTVPIYWGNESVNNDFNKKCFINLIDYESIDEMVDYIKHVDQNEDVYQSYAQEPLFVDNVIPDRFRPEAVLQFFKDTVLSTGGGGN